MACVIREFSQAALESGEVFEVRLKEMIPKREIGICYLKNVSLSQAVRLFVESIQQKNI